MKPSKMSKRTKKRIMIVVSDIDSAQCISGVQFHYPAITLCRLMFPKDT